MGYPKEVLRIIEIQEHLNKLNYDLRSEKQKLVSQTVRISIETHTILSQIKQAKGYSYSDIVETILTRWFTDNLPTVLDNYVEEG